GGRGAGGGGGPRGVDRAARGRGEAGVGLVEHRERGSGGEADDDAERRALAARELGGFLVERQLEAVDKLGRELGRPVRAQARREVEDASDLLLGEVAALAH